MTQPELMWATCSLMLLGAILGLCMKCHQTGGKQKESSLATQRNLSENPQECEAAGSYLGKTRLPVSKASSQMIRTQAHKQLPCSGFQSKGAIAKVSMSGKDHVNELYDAQGTRKTQKHHLPASPLGAFSEPRYQNFRKESQTEQEAAYVDPISADHYCSSGKLLRLASDEDGHSYENVIGPSQISASAVVDMTVYENTAAIQSWKQVCIPEKSNEDGEEEEEEEDPDYINTNPNSRCW